MVIRAAWCEHRRQCDATNLVDGVQKHIDKIDETISEAAIGWTLERMSKVDLSILRNATYEILFDKNIPKAVAINEAVELAKAFGSDNSSKFINGVLGTAFRTLVEGGSDKDATAKP